MNNTPQRHSRGKPVRFCSIRGHTICHSVLPQDPVVFDLGAHRGEFSDEMKARFGGDYYLFEANPNLYTTLKSKWQHHCWNLAICDKSDVVEFNISKNPEGSSLLQLPAESIWDSIHESTIRIKAATLADIFELLPNGISSIDLVKMDIEGAEAHTILGADPKTLARVRQFTIEFHSLPMFGFDIGKEVESVLAKLRRNGFVCMDFSEGQRRDVLCVQKQLVEFSRVHAFVWFLRTQRPLWLEKAWKIFPARMRARLYRMIQR